MKFRKNIVIILSILLLFSNSAMAFNVKFCCEKMIAISTFDSTTSDCHDQKTLSENCCNVEKELDNCCSSKKIELKNKVDYLWFKELKTATIDFVLPILYTNKNTFIAKSVTFKKPTILFCYKRNAPPLFKLFCSFITYG